MDIETEIIKADAFTDLFELSNDGMFTANSKSLKIESVNSRMCHMIGKTKEKLISSHIEKLTSAEKQPALVKFIETVQESDQSQTLTCFLQRSDGFLFPCELKVKGLSDTVLGVFRDITDRIRALEDIHLRNVAIANVSSGVTIADARQPDLPLIYVNKGFQEITGYSAKDSIGRSCRFLQGDDKNQPELDILRDALRKGTSCTVLLRNYRKDGGLFFNELHISPVLNELGELTHFVGIQIDVTDREHSREILERSEARYRLLANSVDDLIIRRTLSGEIEFASSASYNLTGLHPDNLMGRNLFDLIHDDDEELLVTHSKRLIQSREARTTTFRILDQNGGYKWFESRDNFLDASTGNPEPLIVSVLRDVTMRKKAEQEIQSALAHEKEMSEMKTRFISLVSHEFKTPMTSIQASASLLKSYQSKLSKEKQHRHLDNIDNSLKRMNRLLNEVLFFSKAESGKLTIQQKPVNFYLYCVQLIESFTHIFPNRKINLKFNPELSTNYLLDTHLIDHILQNLLSNAIKYSPEEEQVQLEVERFKNNLRITVIDKGIGIPEADQQKLFEAFHRAKNVGTTQGTGLGLNIALRAVQLLQGDINFKSDLLKGSTFSVTFPVTISPV